MTAFTLLGGILDATRFVAASAAHLPVLAIQTESRLIVVEILHSVDTIVASLAIRPKVYYVDLSKIVVVFGVAIQASLVFDYRKGGSIVTLGALHGCCIIIFLVPN